ncbi:aldehyde dehydrogenase family protein [Actinomadura madurae]|uniref:aldehyde dehydrogenase family protein n=1 Tax=Actinomadura madurae TaxID=1993 RepID=UPI00399BB2FC
MTDIATRAHDILNRLGAAEPFTPDSDLVSRSPIDGSEIGRLRSHTPEEAAEVIGRAHAAFERWRTVPAPVRGQFVRELGELLRKHKDDLGALVSIEAGKIVSEGLGEVQEMIDICDLAVGLSRQLHGLTIATERPGHRMMEQWHPLGVIGVISAFNFPVAVWSWNAALALVCGDAVVWKPSEKAILTALGCQALALEAMPAQTEIVKAETFGPLLYVLTYADFDEALALHNQVAQGLSSSIFTLDVREAETFLSALGSDCGIANVNIGPSGAEIGGAFGGEKETGGGRESGSDAWRAYMRRSTNTINYSTGLPLAQGVEFV